MDGKEEAAIIRSAAVVRLGAGEQTIPNSERCCRTAGLIHVQLPQKVANLRIVASTDLTDGDQLISLTVVPGDRRAGLPRLISLDPPDLLPSLGDQGHYGFPEKSSTKRGVSSGTSGFRPSPSVED